ncbi:hypothetical protein ACFYE9_16435 [Rhizobium leguminosarum]|uniref:Uncharacterized protein n=2 Tax=Rhizobium leguminosarum TaxID=384 RepID=A0A154I9W1_RHILE|nr:hypothetical protein [Rhizobium leguminosarum]KZA97326.1 hypothetical protein A4A59_03925 [Rhizobium leguminosarum]
MRVKTIELTAAVLTLIATAVTLFLTFWPNAKTDVDLSERKDGSKVDILEGPKIIGNNNHVINGNNNNVVGGQ